MLVITITTTIVAVAFALEIWSLDSRLEKAEALLRANGLLPQPRHSARRTTATLCHGCQIRNNLVEGNTATPCTCPRTTAIGEDLAEFEAYYAGRHLPKQG